MWRAVARSSRTALSPQPLPTTLQPTGGGGLFGGLFGGSKPAQQQQQPAQQQQQEPAAAAGSGPAAAAAAGPQFPPFQTVQKADGYDLRFYEPYPIIEMDYRRREAAYLTLGQYQDGANAARVRFGFTQPVVMTYHPDGRKTMAMMVGARRGGGGNSGGGGDDGGSGSGGGGAAALPAPTDAAVRLGVAGGEVVAVRRFSGYITPATAEEARRALLAALERDGLKVAEPEAGGLFRVAQYGQVYTLEERLNELLLRVQL